MPGGILRDSIRPVDLRESLEAAVITVLENKPGRWKVWLTQGKSEPGFSIRIDGPGGAQLSYRFQKPRERSPEFLAAKIENGLRGLEGDSAPQRADLRESISVAA